MLTQLRDRLKTYKARSVESPKALCAGVVIPLFEKEGRLFIILTKRTEQVRVHKGEVSFPGGMCEESDIDVMSTALRECCEEIGVSGKDVEIIGRLDDMMTLTGFVITPYVGIIPYPYTFTANPQEVDYLIYLPLETLMAANPEYQEASYDGRTMSVPSIYFGGDRIWGATCRLLLQLRQIIENEEV
jgi:8-oxo-dGTP pyrophosphatase MutT (NUDIX family)